MKVALFGVATFVVGLVFSNDIKVKYAETVNDASHWVSMQTGKKEELWAQQKQEAAARSKHLKAAVSAKPVSEQR